jgi:type IV pilus assembly protein PilQ
MKSLQRSGYAIKAVIALMIIGTCVLFAAAQRVEPQSQGRMYGEPGFRGEPINLNVVNADIRDILNYITEQYGINFVLDKSVKNTPVTVNVSDVPWNVALSSILKSQDLDIQVNGSILRVADRSTLAADEEVDRKIRESQLNASPLMTKYVRLNYARAKDQLVKGVSSAGTRSDPTLIGGVAEVVGGGASGGSSSGGAGLLPIVQRRLSKRGSIEVDGRSNSLIITDVKENIDRIMDLIAILDQPEPQVEIETRIVVATRNFSRDLGSQLTASLFGSRGQGGTFGTDLSASNPVNSVLSLTTGIFGTAQIDLAITAGERKGQAKIIASPRVTVLNNQEATIQSGTKIPIQTIQPGQTGGTPIVTTEYVDVPLKLTITPQITDVGTVVLQVLAENASTAISAPGVPPAINNQKMDTQVTVPDGGTTVVGGVLFDDERENQDRTPGLSKIPIFGNLFRRKGVQRDTNEILFFITPRIQKPDFGTATGTAGVRTEGTFIQPVPLGNPSSNSETPVQPGAGQPLTVQPLVASPQPSASPRNP